MVSNSTARIWKLLTWRFLGFQAACFLVELLQNSLNLIAIEWFRKEAVEASRKGRLFYLDRRVARHRDDNRLVFQRPPDIPQEIKAAVSGHPKI